MKIFTVTFVTLFSEVLLVLLVLLVVIVVEVVLDDSKFVSCEV